MRRFCQRLLRLIPTVLLLATAHAQSVDRREYITSSSPLPDGSRVSTTFVRDANGNFVPQVPVSPAPPAAAGPGASPGMTPGAAVTYPPWAATNPAVPGPGMSGTASGPMPTPNYMTRMPEAEQLAILQAAQRSNVPSLGYPGTKVAVPGSGTGHSCACGLLKGCRCCTTPRPITPFPPPPQQTLRLPDGQVYPYPSLNPAAGVANPSSVAGGAPPSTSPPVRFDPNNPTQPLIKMQNLPPGTYNGKGVFGHPAQYVDGQPMRNLFRFMFN